MLQVKEDVLLLTIAGAARVFALHEGSQGLQRCTSEILVPGNLLQALFSDTGAQREGLLEVALDICDAGSVVEVNSTLEMMVQAAVIEVNGTDDCLPIICNKGFCMDIRYERRQELEPFGNR